MKSYSISSRVLSVFTCFSLIVSPVLHAYDQKFLDYVSNSNLNTFQVIDKVNVVPKKLEEQTMVDHFKAIFTPRLFQIKELSERDKRETVFKQVPHDPQEQEAIIDTSFVDKMELIHGNTHKNDHLMHFLTSHNGDSLIATEFGKKRCVEMLCQPIDSIEIIKQRQAIIKEFVHNDELRAQCEKLLTQVGQAEILLLDLYQYENIADGEKPLYFPPFWAKFGLNDQSWALSGSTRLMQALGFLQSFAFAKLLPDWYMNLLAQGRGDLIPTPARYAARGIMGIPITIILTSVHKQFINATKNIQQKLIGANTCIQATKQLIAHIAPHNEIISNMPHVELVTNQLKFSHLRSYKFKELMALFNESTFNPGEPSMFSSPGNILRAYNHMVNPEVRLEFDDIFNFLGEIDLYVALAKKIKLHEEMPVHYSFVEFSHNSAPSISAHGFWNPFVNSNVVVTNDAHLGIDGMGNLILTGPNTGGKSTLLKALMANALLAQTFGIASAAQLEITPFAKLTCHMNITDDTAGGVSLFKAEINRAQELMAMVRALPKDQFAFIIIDEIFTGTAPDKAEDLSYKFIKQLSEFPNVIFVDATHFAKLTQMEQETNRACQNYHMGVIVNAEGKVTKYTYKLVPGPSPINNAQQIAEEEGIF